VSHPSRYFAILLGTLLTPAGCARWQTSQVATPANASVVRDQLVIHSDWQLPSQHRMIEELCQQRWDLLNKLSLPPSNEPIHVYLFDNSDRFNAFMRLHYPDFPARRAFFVETDTRLAVYAHWGDRVAEDLRHEVSHGYLHSVIPNLPLWLDEGLAEYFEVPRGHAGLNRPHVDELVNRLPTGWRPDLRRLESLTQVNEMTQIHYAESWLWVHFLLETSRERQELLRGYLARLRGNGTAEPLSFELRRTHPHPEGALLDYLQNLAVRS
jgi:hypothetical protein